MIILNVSQYLIWYYLLAVGIIGISLFASYIHNKAFPVFFGISLAVIIIYVQAYLSPIIFGVLNYDYSTQFYEWMATGVFSIMFFGYIGLMMYNLVQYGGVWE